MFWAAAGLVLLAGAAPSRADEVETRPASPVHSPSDSAVRPAPVRRSAVGHASGSFVQGAGAPGKSAALAGIAATPRSLSVSPTSIAPSSSEGFGAPLHGVGYSAAPSMSRVAPVMGGTPIQPDGGYHAPAAGGGAGLSWAKHPDTPPSAGGSSSDPFAKVLAAIGGIFKSLANAFSN
jgi:hypothetical protein